MRQKEPNHVKGKARKINEIIETPLISFPYDQCCDTEVNPARAEQGQLRDGDPVFSTNKKPNTPTKATKVVKECLDLGVDVNMITDDGRWSGSINHITNRVCTIRNSAEVLVLVLGVEPEPNLMVVL